MPRTPRGRLRDTEAGAAGAWLPGDVDPLCFPPAPCRAGRVTPVAPQAPCRAQGHGTARARGDVSPGSSAVPVRPRFLLRPGPHWAVPGLAATAPGTEGSTHDAWPRPRGCGRSPRWHGVAPWGQRRHADSSRVPEEQRRPRPRGGVGGGNTGRHGEVALGGEQKGGGSGLGAHKSRPALGPHGSPLEARGQAGQAPDGEIPSRADGQCRVLGHPPLLQDQAPPGRAQDSVWPASHQGGIPRPPSGVTGDGEGRTRRRLWGTGPDLATGRKQSAGAHLPLVSVHRPGRSSA